MKKIGMFVLLSSIGAFAQAGLPGVYVSKDACQLTVEMLEAESGYADAVYSMHSDGTGACEWSGVGIAKRTSIEGGIISNGGSIGFANMSWVFGPEGNKVDVVYYEPDGTERHKETFTRKE
ncbi:hypothetical protein NBRC116493_27070 [Aurantivibrio infirmus]